jgi:branched-chain amino acid transport system substrate-binding protein|tara:strand:+ start:6016 stop:7131 length:1116 start_codon:yes stop_codon:yes gene_type:complete
MRRTSIVLAAAAAVMAGSMGLAQAQIKIATVGPITGQYAAFGEQMKRGLEMAVSDINAAGGVNGEQLIAVVGDDACDPKQAVAVANKMAADGVSFVAGHFCSSSSIPASAVYAEEGILMISPASTNPALTDDAQAKGWNNVHRVAGRDDAQGIVAGNFLADTYEGSDVAILHDKTAYGKGLADETRKQFNARGKTEGMYEAYTAGEKDYSALVSKMKSAGIKAFYVGGYHTEAGLMIRQAQGQGYNPQLVSGDALVTDEFWKITGKAGEGTLMTFAPDPRKLPSSVKLVEKFRSSGYEPEGYTLYTYAAVQVFTQAATATGSVDVDALSEAIRGNSFDTVLGRLTFDEKGDVKNPEYVWYIWKDGKYSEKM